MTLYSFNLQGSIASFLARILHVWIVSEPVGWQEYVKTLWKWRIHLSVTVFPRVDLVGSRISCTSLRDQAKSQGEVFRALVLIFKRYFFSHLYFTLQLLFYSLLSPEGQEQLDLIREYNSCLIKSKREKNNCVWIPTSIRPKCRMCWCYWTRTTKFWLICSPIS